MLHASLKMLTNLYYLVLKPRNVAHVCFLLFIRWFRKVFFLHTLHTVRFPLQQTTQLLDNSLFCSYCPFKKATCDSHSTCQSFEGGTCGGQSAAKGGTRPPGHPSVSAPGGKALVDDLHYFDYFCLFSQKSRATLV